MKKLMIAAAIVCAAAMSQAAVMKWGQTTAIKTPDPANDGKWSTTSLGSSGHAYLFELTKKQYDALFANGSDYATVADTIFDTYATVNDQGRIVVSGSSQDKNSSGGKIKSFTDSRTFYTDGADKTAYAAMIITTTGSDGNDYYIANAATYTFAADMDRENGNMGLWQFGDATSEGKTQITGWTAAAVPEPTSAMLLLLGVAGLALRRRRA